MEEYLTLFFDNLIKSFAFDFGRYLFGAGGVFLLVWIMFKAPLQGRKIRRKTPKARQMLREFAHSIKTVVVYAFVGVLTIYGVRTGIMEFYLEIESYGWAYYGFSLVAIIVAHDAYFYWAHWLMHRPGAMKYIHAVHHKTFNPTPWAAYSFDIFEAAAHAAFVPLFLLFMPVHVSVIMIFLTHMIIRNAVGHSGYELFPRSWAAHPFWGFLTSVTHHDMHHANGKYNMGLYFSWWDRIMGTEHPEYIARVTKIPGATRDNYQTLKTGMGAAAE